MTKTSYTIKGTNVEVDGDHTYTVTVTPVVGPDGNVSYTTTVEDETGKKYEKDAKDGVYNTVVSKAQLSENGIKGTDIFVELCAMPDKIPFYKKFGFDFKNSGGRSFFSTTGGLCPAFV